MFIEFESLFVCSFGYDDIFQPFQIRFSHLKIACQTADGAYNDVVHVDCIHHHICEGIIVRPFPDQQIRWSVKSTWWLIQKFTPVVIAFLYQRGLDRIDFQSWIQTFYRDSWTLFAWTESRPNSMPTEFIIFSRYVKSFSSSFGRFNFDSASAKMFSDCLDCTWLWLDICWGDDTVVVSTVGVLFPNDKPYGSSWVLSSEFISISWLASNSIDAVNNNGAGWFSMIRTVLNYAILRSARLVLYLKWLHLLRTFPREPNLYSRYLQFLMETFAQAL